jgi:hypothetical protein
MDGGGVSESQRVGYVSETASGEQQIEEQRRKDEWTRSWMLWTC